MTIASKSFAAAVVTTVLWGCATTTNITVKPAEIAAKTDSVQRGQIHTERAAEYFRLGRMAPALEAAEQATRVSPQYAPGFGMLAIIFMELREDAKAQTAFEQALRLTPNDSEVLNNYGWFQCQRQSAARSLALFQQALRNPLYSTPERALFNWGVCARKAGDLPRAEEQLRATLQRAPLFTPAMLELADLNFAQARVAEADALLSRYLQAVQAAPAEALLLGVQIARAKRDRAAEASYISQLRRRFPDAPQTLALTGGR
jgi:type IV pilus assembly protein PilF